MDQSVLDAVKRWPDVPAVYGWLSLTARGEWKLHPLGDAQLGGAGQGITNKQILSFIGRNYSSQTDGAWFFQNGPQRVYVRLDATPLILHVDPSERLISAHNGGTIQHIVHWYCDENGQLYAQTDCGPGRIDDRDLHTIADVLRSADGRSLFDLFELFEQEQEQEQSLMEKEPNLFMADLSLSDPRKHYCALTKSAPLSFVREDEIPRVLHFIPNPGPSAVHSDSLGRKIAP
jgi:hypothetical protein